MYERGFVLFIIIIVTFFFSKQNCMKKGSSKKSMAFREKLPAVVGWYSRAAFKLVHHSPGYASCICLVVHGGGTERGGDETINNIRSRVSRDREIHVDDGTGT